MSDYQFALLMGFLVKALIIAAGCGAIFMGYRLFTKGVFRGGAGVKVEGWKAAVALDRGGPGLVFCLFGAVVLVVGILKPVSASHERTDQGQAVNDVMAPTPGPQAPTVTTITVKEQAAMASPPRPAESVDP